MKKITALVMLILFVSAPVFAQKYASINAKRANIRSCGGPKCSIKWYAWRYTPVIMVKASSDKEWVLVKDFEGFNGWVSSSLLSPLGSMTAKLDVNVRKTASSNSEIVCTVEKGYPFKYISKKGAWVEVKDEPASAADEPCQGWVYAKNLWGFFKQ